jgi:SAM-dependent methyltransferase
MMRKESFKYAFDSIAKTYDDIRPGYPESVINTIVTVSKIPTDGRILEIGCGTGQATLAFARLGYYMECLDIGKTMCSITRQKCSRYPKIRVHNRMFETWNPRFSQYDIVLAAQSFHWIEPAVGFLKISRLLKNKGSIALLWNEHPRPYKGFFQKVRKIYDAVFPEEKKPKNILKQSYRTSTVRHCLIKCL